MTQDLEAEDRPASVPHRETKSQRRKRRRSAKTIMQIKRRKRKRVLVPLAIVIAIILGALVIVYLASATAKLG